MQKIIKRLSVIKACIVLEDDDAIAHQLETLSLVDDVSIQEIVALISSHSYADTLNEIDLFISKNTGLIAFKDEQVKNVRKNTTTVK